MAATGLEDVEIRVRRMRPVASCTVCGATHSIEFIVWRGAWDARGRTVSLLPYCPDHAREAELG